MSDDANQWVIDNHAFLSGLDISIEEQREGFVRLRLPHEESLTNPGSEVLQGGVVATLVDHGGGAALRTTLERPLETSHATTELNVSYLRPAADDLVAEATVVRTGTSIGVVRVLVTAQEGKNVADGRVSLHINREGGINKFDPS